MCLYLASYNGRDVDTVLALLITNPGNISDYGNVQWIMADNKLHILLG